MLMKKDILNTLYNAKKLGYETVIYHSARQQRKSIFKRKTFDLFINKEGSRFDYIIKANSTGDIFEFANRHDVDLSQSIFITSVQNVLKDLNLRTFTSIKLLDAR